MDPVQCLSNHFSSVPVIYHFTLQYFTARTQFTACHDFTLQYFTAVDPLQCLSCITLHFSIWLLGLSSLAVIYNFTLHYILLWNQFSACYITLHFSMSLLQNTSLPVITELSISLNWYTSTVCRHRIFYIYISELIHIHCLSPQNFLYLWTDTHPLFVATELSISMNWYTSTVCRHRTFYIYISELIHIHCLRHRTFYIPELIVIHIHCLSSHNFLYISELIHIHCLSSQNFLYIWTDSDTHPLPVVT